MPGGFFMRRRSVGVALASGFALFVITAVGQEMQPVQTEANPTPEQRAAATRAFLGLGRPPDKAAAQRAAPTYQQSCAFCHGPQARGATGPGLITSDIVLGDDHGEVLVPFLKAGRPEKGMPAFSRLTDQQLTDLAEFLHQQVEDVANRGAYQVQNIVVGDALKGQAYVVANCMTCHNTTSFAHIASKYRSPDQLHRNWIWPTRPVDNSLSVSATVKIANGPMLSGRITQVSDFRVTLVDNDGKTHVIERGPSIDVRIKDPLAPHQTLVMTLRNEDMHNVTAYLETLK
jgi:cytochrome c oxidase cbb3-type subunit III